ncbi:hypothetical protein BU23DRAFT_333201 [Bimuria novae-zelandiae CBS 107.79]|uniref:Secreted protein n=1 Tax=Bimuria novae-zelandiae CBS 107.79 TaxID=1447943 RepID=A0A6A5UMZ4_9PLEO|nr:hypothetical protein BU23DRAFT_333201 [Bimuria novae-zelandiae CBS 107.79]
MWGKLGGCEQGRRMLTLHLTLLTFSRASLSSPRHLSTQAGIRVVLVAVSAKDVQTSRLTRTPPTTHLRRFDATRELSLRTYHVSHDETLNEARSVCNIPPTARWLRATARSCKPLQGERERGRSALPGCT